MKQNTRLHLAALGALALLTACGKDDDDGGKKAAAVAPAVDCKVKPTTSLNLLDDNTLAEDQALVEAALARRAANGWSAVVVRAYRNGVGADASHFDLKQQFAGVPLCGYAAKANVVAGEASVPFLPSYAAPATVDEAAFGDARDVLARAAASTGRRVATAVVRNETRCFQPVAGVPVPARDIEATIGGWPYRIVGNDTDLFLVESESLEVAATAKVFQRNLRDAAGPVAVPIDVSATGTMATDMLRVVGADGQVTGPTAVDGKIEPEVGTPAFLEASLFAHVQEQMAYDLPFRKTSAADCFPIAIEAHATDGPVYNPSFAEGDGHPRIYVPDQLTRVGANGKEVVLDNLATDYDAVAHETNHHFVFQRLKSVRGEAKLIHEGLADFFVFAHTGDTCLADTICKAGILPEACEIPGSCLREGDVAKSGVMFHNAKYDSYSGAEHRQSQALSGLLVAIGREPDVGADTIAKVMFAGIDFLKENSALSDWIEAVLQGDKATFAGAHACKILAKAKEFGLASETASLDCQSYVVR